MTREEAVKKLRLFDFIGSNEDEEFLTSLTMAIKILEQEPCEDAISRQAVIEYIEGSEAELGHSSENELVCQHIKELPPVTPQSKIGRWIKHDTGHSVYYDCSLCSCAAPCTETADKILWKMANYCPNCGAKMEDVKDETTERTPTVSEPKQIERSCKNCVHNGTDVCIEHCDDHWMHCFKPKTESEKEK